jgi:hypothetical protein
VARPIVALLSDFGSIDHYVGAMKGAILSVCREASLVDITHGIAPQDVAGGARHLAAAAPYFPPGTVFVAVVDPGVGTGRRAIAASAGGCHFVGPDNGVLSWALEAWPVEAIVAVENSRVARPTVSRTFEGRDRFGPAAGWLALGTPLADLGPAVTDFVRLERHGPVAGTHELRGEVAWVDRFGNLVSNVSRADWDRLARGRHGLVFVAGQLVGQPVATYGAVSTGEPCAVFGSTDHLEIALRDGNAAERFVARAGTPVTVVWR